MILEELSFLSDRAVRKVQLSYNVALQMDLENASTYLSSSSNANVTHSRTSLNYST